MGGKINDFDRTVAFDVVQDVFRSLLSMLTVCIIVLGNTDMVVLKVMLQGIAYFVQPLRVIVRHIMGRFVFTG